VKCCWYIALVAIFLAFAAVGLHVYNLVMACGAEEVFGYDYATYMAQMRDIKWITYTGFRHPGIGLLLSPVVLAASMLSSISPPLCDGFIVFVMASMGVMNFWLVKRIGGWIAAGIFLTFGFSWVLASVPESFPFAMGSLLLVIVTCCEEICRRREGVRPLPLAVWAGLFLLAGGVTITNGAKVVIAYLICNWSQLNKMKMSIGGRKVSGLLMFVVVGMLIAFFGISFFLVRMHNWNVVHPEAPKTIVAALGQTLSWIPEGLGFWGRVKGAILNFAFVPIVPRFSYGDLACPSIPALAGNIWCFVVCSCALASAILNRRLKIVQVMASMFTVDFLIHVVCGWGLDEGWVFCAHWFWMVPILIGLFVRRRIGE